MKPNKDQKPAAPQTEIDRIAAALVTIIQSPETPADLYNDVTQWITDATNIEDSEGETLCSRWTYHPDTIRACVSWSIEDHHRKEDEAQIVARGIKQKRNRR